MQDRLKGLKNIQYGFHFWSPTHRDFFILPPLITLCASGDEGFFAVLCVKKRIIILSYQDLLSIIYYLLSYQDDDEIMRLIQILGGNFRDFFLK